MTHTDPHALANHLRAAARAYYDTDTLVMSDDEFDAGIEALRATEEASTGAFDDLFTKVAGGASAGGTVQHPSLMGSMDKITSSNEVTSFMERVAGPVTVEPKLDGLAVRVVYTDGTFTLAATRGDGHTGEDITDQMRSLHIVPETVPVRGVRGLRGEVFMRDENFPAANTIRTNSGGEPFANPRNAAAGILRKGDPAYANLLSFAAYGGEHYDDAETMGIPSAATLVNVPGYSSDPVTATADVQALVDVIEKNRDALGFPIDGAIIKAARASDRDRLGEGSRAPKWAIAYKYRAEGERTTVRAIHENVGRTGRLSLQIEVDPVTVGGTTITYASGHNVSWMQSMDVRVGDTVTLTRAGDVIPYITSVLTEHRPADSVPWTPPATDPAGNPWDTSTLLWRSTTPELSVLGRIEYALSRDCLDVEGVGKEIAAALVDNAIVNDIADIFAIDTDTLATLTLGSGRTVGAKVAAKIIAEINEAKNSEWNRVITSLGIRATGRTMGRRLAAAFPTMNALRGASITELSNVDGIGAKKAALIHAGLRDLSDAGVLDRLAAAGVTMAAKHSDANAAPKPLNGHVVVVTGKVGSLNRTEVQERIETLGGTASSSVSSSTTILVADPNATSSKAKKAQSLGVRIMSPEDFLAL